MIFNYLLFQRLIPNSCLVDEIRAKFFLGAANRNDSKSVFFQLSESERKEKGIEENIYDEEIRKYYDVLGIKINEKNMDELC